MKHFKIGKIVFCYSNDNSWAQWEKAGMSLRLGRHLFSAFHENYRDLAPGWPKLVNFSLAFNRPE